LDVLVGDALDVTIANFLVPDLQGFASEQNKEKENEQHVEGERSQSK
jgi:hypothetical protein